MILLANVQAALAAPPVDRLTQVDGLSAAEVLTAGLAGELPVHAPGGREFAFKTASASPEAGMFGIHGQSDDGARLLIFVSADRILSGDIYSRYGRYQLIEDSGRYAWVPYAAGWPMAPAGPVEAEELPDVAIPGGVETAKAGMAPTVRPDAEGNYQIDLLALYTRQARQSVGGAKRIREEAQRLTFVANSFFVNSLMPVRYRVAELAEFNGTSESEDYHTNQQAMADSEAVRKLRDKVAADLVILFRTDHDGGFCGLGGLFNGGDQTDPPGNVDPERDAFAVVGVVPDGQGEPCIGRDHLFAHELGHCMSGGHQFTFTGIHTRDYGVTLGAYWRPYGHASYCGVGGDGVLYNTIMMGGVRPGVYLQGGNLLGDHFSNPHLMVDGMPCGIAPVGATEAEMDNARSISEAAPYIGAYRVSARDALEKRDSAAASATGAPAPVLRFAFLMAAFARRYAWPHDRVPR